MKQEVKIGQTDYTVLILIRDTAGAPKTGLTNASAGIDVCYHRVETDNDVVLTDAALVALATPALTDVHLDWGFLEVSSTKAPGLYRLDIADGVFATGAWSAVVSIIATGIDPCQIEFILVPELPYNGVDVYSIRGTAQTANDNGADINDILTDTGTTLQADTTEILTRIPDATAGANGGLTICGSNAATTFATLSVTGQLDAGNVLVDAATVLTGNVSMADGLTIPAPSTGNRAGIAITGNGTGSGVIVTGGSTSGNAVTVVGGAPNGIGAYIQGDGNGSAIRGDGGETGHGLQLTGGSTSGDGLNTTSPTSGHGVYAIGAGAGAGLHSYGGLTGNGIEAAGGGTSGDGIYAKAAGTGNGLACHGGGIAGDGLYAIADNDGDGASFIGDTNGNGILATGSGSGEGVSITGGDTGDGVDISGGGTSGSGIYIVSPTSGHGIEVTGGGAGSGITALGGATSGAGILATGGANHANADGIRAVAGGALGADIDADLTWSAAWDAEVQSECNDALVAYDPPTNAEMIARTSLNVISANPAYMHNPTIDQANIVVAQVGLISNKPRAAPIQIAEVTTPGLIKVWRYRVGVDVGWTLIVAGGGMAAAVGGIYYAYTFPNADWASGDLVLYEIYNTVVTLDTEVFNMSTVQGFGVVGQSTLLASVKVDTAAIKVRTDLLPSGIKKNTALTNFEFYMVLAADHISPALLKVVDCQRSIDGAAFANCNTAVATEVSAGIYKLNLAASDLNGDVITFKFTEAACDTRMVTIKTST